jgi:hypothetical protein
MLKDQHSMRTVTKISDNVFNMHDKKVAIFSLSALCFNGILDVKRVLCHLCDVSVRVPKYGPFRIYLGLR